ncbi:MAG TPA: efflux RND transporter periplasmic adaptor subunit [Reyranella sp.]|jgi:Cu(I)/Ag(I) efflux system membrane fusion protein|nr:efflux RND transporter periplasmic adaptor subunit [Reyranella sp.]
MTVVARLRSGIAGAAAFAIFGIALVDAPAVEAADTACPGGKVKYYRNPMGTPDTSPVPKKDSMNMDYIPVCEDTAGEAPGTVKVSLDKVQRLGVRTGEVQQRALSRTVRAYASLQFDERRQFVVAPKFSGWIEKLAVNATGDSVQRGQVLFEVYSPELNVLQQEWNLAGRGSYASDKLRNLDYPEAGMEKLRRGERPRTISIPSPVSGTVTEKIAVEGARFRAGDALFRIVDTINMWVMAEVYEQDLAFVKVGDVARITVNTWPDHSFEGRVTFIYPSVGKDSRTARLRIEVPNPDGRLRAEMAATVEIASPLEGQRIVVPESAVIDSGRRQAVLVERGEGHYEPRPVRLGVRVPGYIEVLDGLQAGERVVTQATFLIDAESNIRAALAAFGDAK